MMPVHAHLLHVMSAYTGAVLTTAFLSYVCLYRKDAERYRAFQWRATSWLPVCAFFFGGMLLGKTAFLIAMALLAAQSLREFMRATGVHYSTSVHMLLGGIIALQYGLMWSGQWILALLLPIIVTSFGVPAVMLRVGGAVRNSYLQRMTALWFAVMMCVHGMALLPMLWTMPLAQFNGEYGAPGLMLFAILMSQSNDGFQYIWGKLLGKRPCAPTLSPNKTWEGLFGGVMTMALVGGLLGWWITTLGPVLGAGLGVVMSGLGFLGDLVMSAIKRDLGIKDMGTLLPEMGGVLDRIDSMLLSTPFFFCVILILAFELRVP